ncbi:glycosyltransferase family 2 protein [Anatilimnocola sp. NA78]|uniref:glycosyltransferase family 2 protein n=1 Tax=Anatilimnocola sp. NA78 TaxID=3415683 RepID=UPI003CE591B6
MDVSIVVPIHNELENITRLHEQVIAALAPTELDFELILVDDGSHDGSTLRLRDLAQQDNRVRVIELRRNFGQSAAMLAGIRESHGTYIVTMDGDLQNDPTDIPRMVAKLEEGYDLVHGWRRDRKDRWLDRKLPSLLANKLISRVTRFAVHDLGCTLKAMRREVALEIELYGEMHRFIPILADMRGAKCVELEVKHHPRLFGTTKYGINRTLRVFLDLLTVTYLKRYAASPMRLFGRWGLIASCVSMLLLGAALVYGVMSNEANLGLIIGGLLTMGISAQCFGLGLLAETASRIYFAGRDEAVYAVRHRWEQTTAGSANSSRPISRWRKAG